MARYVISQSQLFDLVENFMSDRMVGGEVKKHDTDEYGNTKWELFDKNGKWLMHYIHYSTKDMGEFHFNESGNLALDKSLVSLFMRNLRFRESKVLDLMADWFSKTFDVDVDKVDIFMRYSS